MVDAGMVDAGIVEAGMVDAGVVDVGPLAGSRAVLVGVSAYEYAEFPPIRAAANSLESDRKSTRLNSSHLVISYAVFCLKKKKKNTIKIFYTKKKKQKTKK